MENHRPDRIERKNHDWPTPWQVELLCAETKWLAIGCVMGAALTLLVGAAL